jgi:mxaJ protein
VASGDVDVAAVWGPLAGYFVARASEPLALVPVHPAMDAQLPQVFDISMAVRRDDVAALARLERFIDLRRADIDRILREYHVPLLEAE